MDDIEQLIAGLSKEAAAKPSPRPLVLAAKWLAIAAVYLVASLALGGLRADISHALHNPWFIAELAALIGLVVSAALGAAVLAFPDLHQQRRTAYAPLALFGLFALMMLLAWRADAPPAPLPEHSWQCTLSILLFSLLPAVGVFYAMRNLASTRPQLAGMVALLFAFATGALWLRLHEVNDSISHVLLWHYLPMLAVGLLGLWLGKKLLKW